MAKINARIHDRDELFSYSSKNPFTGEVQTWGGTLLADAEDGWRNHRLVYIIAGTTSRAVGGPEEGGWHYDHFHESFRVAASVASEDELTAVLEKVDTLLTAVQGPAYTEIRVGGSDDYGDELWPEFHRPHYE